MRGYHLHWHTITGAALLCLLLVTIFFPGMSITAEKYIDSVAAANQYAYDKDSELNSAGERALAYGREGNLRPEIRKSYEKEIIKNGDSSITRLFLAKWCLTVDEGLDEIDGIELKSNRSLKNSGVKGALRFWGWLIYLPFLVSMVTFVFVLVKGRTLPGLLLFDGVLTLICECLSHFLIPPMLWSSGKSAVYYFELVDEDVLAQYGAGEKFLEELLHRCGGLSWIIVSIIAALLIVHGIICLILWGKEMVGKGGKSKDWNMTGDNPTGKDTGWTNVRPGRRAGELRGIKGEYIGQSITILPGEEVVLGRDAKYCMLIFASQKVSRRQCGVRYDVGKDCYQVIDYSSGGTTLPDGRVRATSEYTVLFPGAVICMAGGREIFMLM